MKIRTDFVTNSSSSSYVCEICGRSESGWDIGLRDCEMMECVNGHVFCCDEALELPSKKEMIKAILENEWNEKRRYSYYTGTYETITYTEEQLNDYEDETLFFDFYNEEGHYNVPECVCPICQFIEYSEYDLSAYLLKEYKIPKSEVWVNSTMKNASLKVGDKVRIKLAEHRGKIYTVKEVLQDWRNKNRIAGYILKGPDGEKKRLDLAFLDTLQNSVYSSNPIVQNALKARNADPYLGEKLKLMLAHEAVSVSGGGKPSVDDVVFEHRGKKYYVGKDSAHMVKQFADARLVKMVNSEWRKKYGV